MQGRGQKQLTISTSDRKLLNFILQHVTYTSTVYQHHSVDVGEILSLDGNLRREPEITTGPSPSLPPPGSLPAWEMLSLLLFLTLDTSLPNCCTQCYPHVATDAIEGTPGKERGRASSSL